MEDKMKEVRGRTVHLLSFDTTWTKQKTMPPTILCCHGAIFSKLLPSNNRGIHFTKPLPSNDKEGYTYRHKTDGRDLWSTPLIWAQVPYIPSFIKTGAGIQKLIGGIHRHTHTAWRSHANCSNFCRLKFPVAFSCTFLFSLAHAISIRFKSHVCGSSLTTVWPYTGRFLVT
jgi:hypothetical protein